MIKTFKIVALFSIAFVSACGSVVEQPVNQVDQSTFKNPASFLGTSLTFNPVFDTYVKQSTPTTSYATSTTLSSDGDPASGKQSYLEFNVSGVVGTITAATLRLKVGAATNSGTADQIVIKKIGSALPTAARQLTGTYTWNARPTVNSAIVVSKTGGFAVNASVDFAIPTSVVTGNGYYAFAVLDNSGADKVDFLSMEGATKPQLIITYTPTNVAPAAPSGLAASPVSSTSVNLAWVDNANNETGFVIQRATDSGFTQNLANFAASSNAVAFADTVPASNTTYYYQVKATNSYGTSAGVIAQVALASSTQCSVPDVNSFGTLNITGNSAAPYWVAVSGANSYNVEYRIRNSGASYSSPISTSNPSIVLSSLQATTNYEFIVQAVCSGASSAFSTSGWFTTTTGGSTSTCNAPTGLSAGSITNTGATLGWAAATNAVSYNAQYRQSGGSSWTPVTSSTTSKAISGLTLGTSYEFQVQSVCASSSSAFSSSSFFTTTGGTSSCSNMYSAGSSIVPKDIWVWRDSIDVINNATSRSDFFTFAEQKNVVNIYLNVRTMLEKYGTGSPETNTQTNLATFINTAASKCMKVEFLIGNGGSYVSDAEKAANYPTMTTLVNRAIQYNNGLAGSKAIGVHWDLEPQQLGSVWNSNKKEYVQRLVDSFNKMRTLLSAANMIQAEDIAHWWDNSDGGTTYNGVTCGANTLVGAQCLIQVLDKVVIMDYRDTSSPVISQANHEMTYANTATNLNGHTTIIVVGQETGNMNDPTAVNQTFYEELRGLAGNDCAAGFSGTKCMEKELQAVHHNYNSAASFGGRGLETMYSASTPGNSFYLRPVVGGHPGIALHHYESFNSSGVIFNFP